MRRRVYSKTKKSLSDKLLVQLDRFREIYQLPVHHHHRQLMFEPHKFFLAYDEHSNAFGKADDNPRQNFDIARERDKEIYQVIILLAYSFFNYI